MRIALVLGCGRSLNDLPIDLLRQYPSYGCNYIGMSGIQPTYYVCVDYRTLQDYERIEAVARNAETVYLGRALPKSSPIYALPNAVLLSKDRQDFKEERSFAGGTVVYPMLKLAYYAGFDKVLLWGVDFDPDWAHFTTDYPYSGHPDRKIDAMLFHLSLAASVYQKARKRIINFSLPSVLDNIFERGSGLVNPIGGNHEANISRASCPA